MGSALTVVGPAVVVVDPAVFVNVVVDGPAV